MRREPPLGFPEIVQRELLRVLADPQAATLARNQSDPKVRQAVLEAHHAAQKVGGAAGAWAVFATAVGQAGFAPYILAAKASAFVPIVGGPALVSLLAVLVNPATRLVGVGALGWIGLGRGGRILRSQVAARLCVLLAAQGTTESGLNRPGFAGGCLV